MDGNRKIRPGIRFGNYGSVYHEGLHPTGGRSHRSEERDFVRGSRIEHSSSVLFCFDQLCGYAFYDFYFVSTSSSGFCLFCGRDEFKNAGR